MRETVLIYNFTDKDRAGKLKIALLPMGVKIRIVKLEEYLKPIGVLAGLKEMEDKGEEYRGTGFTDEMVVMAGFSSAKVDELILMLKKHGVGKINYKAILTDTNQYWNSMELYEEIKKEYEKMNKERE